MDKKKLQEMGLTEEQITKVLTSLKEGYVEKQAHEQSTLKVETLTKQLKERDDQIAGLKKFEGDAQALKTKLEEMETANKTKADEYNQTLTLERKKSAIRLALLEDEAGKPYDVSMVAGMFNLDTINLNEDGTIANGFKEQNETLRKDKAFLFTTNQGTNPGTKRFGEPPKDGTKNPPVTDTPESFGSRLAQQRLAMMGIKPKTEE